MKIQRSEKLLKTFKDSWEFSALPKGYGTHASDWCCPFYDDPTASNESYHEWERIVSERGIIYTVTPAEFYTS